MATKRISIRCLIATLSFLALFVRRTAGLVRCESDQDCLVKVRQGSTCGPDGICSNPFASGCLRRILGEDKFPERRICNSHDQLVPGEEAPCVEPVLDYSELRLLYQNWDSSMLTGWVIQIFFSEVLRIPLSLEPSKPNISSSFYDPQNKFEYGAKAYDYDALRKALDIGDCRKIQKHNEQHPEEYQSCAHVMPEVWSGQISNWKKAEVDRLIEPAEGTGGVAKLSWYIPRFLAERDPTLLSHFGLRGEENRRKLAETFKRPTSWKEYCEWVSPSNCTVADNVVARPPQNDEEGERYFVEDLYWGFFRETEKNKCDDNPQCTGHIANVECTWSTFVIPQAYHNQIAVESDGPQVNGGYPYPRMLEIWRAADYSKSAVLFYWFNLDPTLEEFAGTDSEFSGILLPLPTEECINSRTVESERCSADFDAQVGDPLGACDSEAHPLQKLVVSNLFDRINRVPEAERSPAYDAVKQFRISDLQIAQIFELWYSRNIDRWGYDPREAVCQWVVDNLDDLSHFIPRDYPREIVQHKGYDVLLVIALALAILAGVTIVSAAVAVTLHRKDRIIQFAQYEFLLLVLGGLFLVSMGAMVMTLDPSRTSCLATSWLLFLGYTFELAPIIVKVAAIQRLVHASRKMRHVSVKKKNLFGAVFILVALAATFLMCMTVLDPPSRQQELELTGNQLDNGSYELKESYSCDSDSALWQYLMVAWISILLFTCVIIAFQIRKVQSKFHEFRRVGLMVYSHFFFLVIRSTLLLMQESIESRQLEGIWSIIFSLDTLATILIYFVPMLVFSDQPDKNRSTFVSGIQQAPASCHSSAGNSVSSDIHDAPDEIFGSDELFEKVSNQVNLRCKVADLQVAVKGLERNNEELENDVKSLKEQNEGLTKENEGLRQRLGGTSDGDEA